MENSITNSLLDEVSESPFSVIFQWQGKIITITLKDSADVFRIAGVYKKLLRENDIDYTEDLHYEVQS